MTCAARFGVSAIILGTLAACAQTPEPLGAANAANGAVHAVDPIPELANRDDIEGGQGGRAGLAVEKLRERAARAGEER